MTQHSTVEIESRDCQNSRSCTVVIIVKALTNNEENDEKINQREYVVEPCWKREQNEIDKGKTQHKQMHFY